MPDLAHWKQWREHCDLRLCDDLAQAEIKDWICERIQKILLQWASTLKHLNVDLDPKDPVAAFENCMLEVRPKAQTPQRKHYVFDKIVNDDGTVRCPQSLLATAFRNWISDQTKALKASKFEADALGPGRPIEFQDQFHGRIDYPWEHQFLVEQENAGMSDDEWEQFVRRLTLVLDRIWSRLSAVDQVLLAARHRQIGPTSAIVQEKTGKSHSTLAGRAKMLEKNVKKAIELEFGSMKQLIQHLMKPGLGKNTIKKFLSKEFERRIASTATEVFGPNHFEQGKPQG